MQEEGGERAAGANGSKASLGPSISWPLVRSSHLSVPGGSSPPRGRPSVRHTRHSPGLRGRRQLSQRLYRGGEGIKTPVRFPGGGPVWQGGPAANLSSLPVPVPGPALERQ